MSYHNRKVTFRLEGKEFMMVEKLQASTHKRKISDLVRLALGVLSELVRHKDLTIEYSDALETYDSRQLVRYVIDVVRQSAIAKCPAPPAVSDKSPGRPTPICGKPVRGARQKRSL